MEFITDKQTLDDLNLLGKYKNSSMFRLFNYTITSGGERLLERMFNNPMTNEEAINSRKDILVFFGDSDITLPFDTKEFEIIENYLRNEASKNRLSACYYMTRLKVLNLIANQEDYLVICEGLIKSIELFARLKELMLNVVEKSKDTAFNNAAMEILELLESKELVKSYTKLTADKLSFVDVLQYDYVYRGKLSERIEKFLGFIYEMDVYISVSKVARENGFVHATAINKNKKVIDIKGLYHPIISKAVDNDVRIDGEKNVLFLTGANMAGKSTLMKSFSVAVYLAHMGFPVAAKEMVFSVHDGIYTSINLPDNLAMGYSHFYAEVLRVKHIAQEVATNKQLVIIFDELFKGTNVKDAYDGTVAIVDAFSKRNGTFIISTHILEAGDTLQKYNNKLFFKYLPTVMNGNIPTYPYKMEDGITDDRHGMIIIKNERILEIINGVEVYA